MNGPNIAQAGIDMDQSVILASEEGLFAKDFFGEHFHGKSMRSVALQCVHSATWGGERM